MLSINNISNGNTYNRTYSPSFKMSVFRPAETAVPAMVEQMTKSTGGELTKTIVKGLKKAVNNLKCNICDVAFKEDGSVHVVKPDGTTRRFAPEAEKNQTPKTKTDKFLDFFTELVDPVRALPKHYQEAFKFAEKISTEENLHREQFSVINKVFNKL